MTITKPKVDVVFVGFGWTASLMAHELCGEGLTAVALERAAARDTPDSYATTFDQDELRYNWRHHLFQNTTYDTLTVRNNSSQVALPYRKVGAFLLGTGVGGSGVHWNGQHWRFLPSDIKAYSHNRERYGMASVRGDGLTVQDYPMSYDDLEPHYARFESLCGVSGKAGNIRGKIQAGGNPFEGQRSGEYPNPPLEMTYAPSLFAKAASEMGYHPFPQPASNITRPYTNVLGAQMGKCTYCGFCERFGCGNYSKATPQTTVVPSLMMMPNFELRTESEVLKVERTPDGKHATGVTYVDSAGQEIFQPADIVVLSAYQLHNVHLMLLSGIGKPYDPVSGEGVVGRNYSYQTLSLANVFMGDKILNPFIGAGALASCIDDFNGDNFDHTGLGFIGGSYVAAMVTGGRPIGQLVTPKRVGTWGADWKRSAAHDYLRSFTIYISGASVSTKQNYLDLDPTYRDKFGRPMLRMTFDFPKNDLKMAEYVTGKTAEIAYRMGAREVDAMPRKAPFDVAPYQTTHTCGGTVIGDDPKTSVVNPYSQSWDVPNLFVTGAGLFPQNAAYNPTNTIAALLYYSVERIKSQYLKAPGVPMVSA